MALVRKYIAFCEKNQIEVKRHQIYGVLWCLKREHEGKGGIIADEMGMGKTIQMIMTMILNPKKKTLLILPPILIPQWNLEILRITGHQSILYYGKKNREKITQDQLENSIVVITSYDTLLKDELLERIYWNRVICDEAHHLRNSKTKKFEKVAAIQTNIAWCMTGTPIHNNISDLVSLFSLCKIPRERSIMKNHFLQRCNPGIKNIAKYEHTEMVEWKDERERETARDVHASLDFLHFAKEDSERSFWSTRKYNNTLVSMLRASQTCIFSKMIETYILEEKDTEEEDAENAPPEYYLDTFQKSSSTKIQELVGHILARKSNGNGKIVFCHFRLEMDRITTLLRERGVDWVGNWKSFQKVREDPTIKTPILILQIRSGCEGLNLQAQFSEVYFVSPDWNPALEAQAVGRCFRIGQKKNVNIYRFYMNSVDTPADNAKRDSDIHKYQWFMNYLPDDVTREIMSYYDPLDVAPIAKCSLDRYISNRQMSKKDKTTKFLKTLQKN
jgi:SNF2 family DNA or RNA helicase